MGQGWWLSLSIRNLSPLCENMFGAKHVCYIFIKRLCVIIWNLLLFYFPTLWTPAFRIKVMALLESCLDIILHTLSRQEIYVRKFRKFVWWSNTQIDCYKFIANISSSFCWEVGGIYIHILKYHSAKGMISCYLQQYGWAYKGKENNSDWERQIS